MKSAKSTLIEYGPVFDLPLESYELLTTLHVDGEPGRKSNQRRIVQNKKTGKPMIIKGKKAMAYQQTFLDQVPEIDKMKWGSAEEPLALWAYIHYASNRPDVSTELIQDLLENAGVISNDRYIKQQFIFGAVDRENPRAEIRLYRIK